MQTTPMRGAARYSCSSFPNVIRSVFFARPSNVRFEPRAGRHDRTGPSGATAPNRCWTAARMNDRRQPWSGEARRASDPPSGAWRRPPGETRTVTRETLRPFSANRRGDPSVRMSPGPTRPVRRGPNRSKQPPSGAMVTPPTAATYSGDLSTPFETRPTTRVTDTRERMMVQALNNPAASTVPDRRASRR